ncbi:MAG: MFS transporter, partial [Chloroflexi bacterium]|nr:MFS transporter [Chloroflexota bacterium]
MPAARSKMRKFYYGNVVLLASVIILTIVYGAMFSFGVFFKPISEEFGWTRAVVSGAYSLNGGLFGFLAIIAGRLIDRFGPR